VAVGSQFIFETPVFAKGSRSGLMHRGNGLPVPVLITLDDFANVGLYFIGSRMAPKRRHVEPHAITPFSAHWHLASPEVGPIGSAPITIRPRSTIDLTSDVSVVIVRIRKLRVDFNHVRAHAVSSAFSIYITNSGCRV